MNVGYFFLTLAMSSSELLSMLPSNPMRVAQFLIEEEEALLPHQIPYESVDESCCLCEQQFEIGENIFLPICQHALHPECAMQIFRDFQNNLRNPRTHRGIACPRPDCGHALIQHFKPQESFNAKSMRYLRLLSVTTVVSFM